MQVACTKHLVSCNSDESFSSFLKQHKVLNSSSVENFDSCKQTSSDSLSFLQQSVYYTCLVRSVDATLKDWYVLSQPKYEKCFKTEELNNLKVMYKALYPDHDKIKLSYFYQESKEILINGEQHISVQSRSKRSATIVAHWPNRSGTNIDCDGTLPMRVGLVMCFFTHEITLTEAEDVKHCLARVKWHEEHPR